jgi:hypothetical protein
VNKPQEIHISYEAKRRRELIYIIEWSVHLTEKEYKNAANLIYDIILLLDSSLMMPDPHKHLLRKSIFFISIQLIRHKEKLITLNSEDI